jgi:hypothetical protein
VSDERPLMDCPRCSAPFLAADVRAVLHDCEYIEHDDACRCDECQWGWTETGKDERCPECGCICRVAVDDVTAQLLEVDEREGGAA